MDFSIYPTSTVIPAALTTSTMYNLSYNQGGDPNNYTQYLIDAGLNEFVPFSLGNPNEVYPVNQNQALVSEEGISTNLQPNKHKYMFDGDYSTFFQTFGNSVNYNSTDGNGGTITFSFGRKIKFRKIKITFSSKVPNEGCQVGTFPSVGCPGYVSEVDTIFHNKIIGLGNNTNSYLTSGDNFYSSVEELDGDIKLGPRFIYANSALNISNQMDIPYTGTDPNGNSYTLSNGIGQLDFSYKNSNPAGIEYGLTDFHETKYLTLRFFRPNNPENDANYLNISQIEIWEEVDLRDYSVEFDDALLDLKGWKNPRYVGSKQSIKKLNQYTGPLSEPPLLGIGGDDPSNPGEPIDAYQIGLNNVVGEEEVWPGDDIPFGQTEPTVSNRTTALYYSTTVVGGDEDDQYATIKKHSYINIQKVLLINKATQTINIIDRDAQGTIGGETNSDFESFHRHITNDFPTGNKLNIKLLDSSIQSSLQTQYHCKMNKGWLLKTFDFNYLPGFDQVIEESGDEEAGTYEATYNVNTLYFYSGSIISKDQYTPTTSDPISGEELTTYGQVNDVDDIPQSGLRFRFANNTSTKPDYNQNSGITTGGYFNINKLGPNFASSSIIQNKFTEQYYTGSFGFFKHNPPVFSQPIGTQYARTALGSASKFIGVDTLNYLQSEYPNTELHITFFEGTKDFAKGKNDERSISTFEVSPNQGPLELGNECLGNLPTSNELIIKGVRDSRFEPTIETHEDVLYSAHIDTITTCEDNEETFGIDESDPNSTFYCLGPSSTGCPDYEYEDDEQTNNIIASLDYISDMQVYVQGGVNGMLGYQMANAGTGISEQAYTNDLYYSGSFNYELSFLDKDHTLIVDIDKENDLPDGIGDNGIILIPEHLDLDIRNNLDFYIQQASNLLSEFVGGAQPEG
jgi:hypothetical protein